MPPLSSAFESPVTIIPAFEPLTYVLAALSLITTFDAVAKMKTSDKHSPLMANVEKNRTEKTLKRMAIPLKDLSMITTSEPVFIINNEKIKESIGTIPVIKSWELKEFENSKELLKIIRERKEN